MRHVMAAVLLVSLGGCATVSETFDGNARCGARPYCGTATDIEYIGMLTDGTAGPLVAFVPLAIIDLPLSLVADTLFLPYTAF